MTKTLFQIAQEDNLINVQELSVAFTRNALPVNPNPFAGGLIKGLAVNGMDWIKTDEAKGILHMLMTMSYGQMWTIDSCDEWTRLRNVQTMQGYDLGYGSKGNGTTVWNRKEQENGDYKTIAHLSEIGYVHFYDENLPQCVKNAIYAINRQLQHETPVETILANQPPENASGIGFNPDTQTFTPLYTWKEVKGKTHDASGCIYPEQSKWYEKSGVYYPVLNPEGWQVVDTSHD